MKKLVRQKGKVSAAEQNELRSIIKELLRLDSGLTEWEIGFLKDLNNSGYWFTLKQAELIYKIYSRLIK